VCFAKCRYTAVLSYLIYAPAGGKDKPLVDAGAEDFERYGLLTTVMN
jgi:hypothetical protein